MAAIGTRGEKLDITFRQGATFGPIPVRMTSPGGVPIDLSGATVRAVMRKSYTSAASFALACSVVDAADGRFQFGAADEVTASMTCGSSPSEPASIYVWDLEVEYPGGRVDPIFYGVVKVAPEATK